MHYHHAAHGERVFLTIGALEGWCEQYGGDPQAIRFCVDEACLRPAGEPEPVEPTD
jgi:hypothetical protein